VTVDDLVKDLQAALADRGDVRFAILFGSSVTRGPEAARDVDLAISTATPLSLDAMVALADDLERVAGKPVDLVELDAANTLVRWEVVRTGRVVTAHDPDALRAFQARVPAEYDDLRPYLEREAAGLRRVLGVR
jgi:uncharacterized protein